jgi:hypothetical protein
VGSSLSGRIIPIRNDRTQVFVDVLLIELELCSNKKQRKGLSGGTGRASIVVVGSSSSGRIIPVGDDRTQVFVDVLLIELELCSNKKQRKGQSEETGWEFEGMEKFGQQTSGKMTEPKT